MRGSHGGNRPWLPESETRGRRGGRAAQEAEGGGGAAAQPHA